MQMYLVENKDKTICAVTDTTIQIGKIIRKNPEETWNIRPVDILISDIDIFRREYMKSPRPCGEQLLWTWYLKLHFMLNKIPL